MNSFCQYLPYDEGKHTRSNEYKSNFDLNKNNKIGVGKKHFSHIAINPKKKISFIKKISDEESENYVQKRKKWGAEKDPKIVYIPEIMDANNNNIFHIDSKIKEILINTISNIPELEKELKYTTWIINNEKDPTQKIIAKKKSIILRKKIQDLESTLELALYIFRTGDLIEDYRDLVKKSELSTFVKVQTKSQEIITIKMKDIANRYLYIAQTYIEIKNLSQHSKNMICSSCNGNDFVLSSDDDSIYICKNCHNEQEILDDAPSFKDTDRVNMSSKYTYSRKGHFVDAKKRFQGTQNTDPKKIQAAAVIIGKEMIQHNLVAIQDLPNSISKDHVYLFLSEQNLSNHYEDLNLLFYIVTGVSCPDISEYEEILDELFDKQEWALDQVKEESRINSLNVNYKLYKLLQKVGYPCRKDDFHILKTPTKEDEHDEKMKMGWVVLNWNWIPTN
jgi:hypothetical protein